MHRSRLFGTRCGRPVAHVSFRLAGSASVRDRPLGVTEHFPTDPGPTDSEQHGQVELVDLGTASHSWQCWCAGLAIMPGASCASSSRSVRLRSDWLRARLHSGHPASLRSLTSTTFWHAQQKQWSKAVLAFALASLAPTAVCGVGSWRGAASLSSPFGCTAAVVTICSLPVANCVSAGVCW